MSNNTIDLLIRKAKIKLFTQSLIFFGICSQKFIWKVSDFSPEIEGFVIFNDKDLSKIEYGTININKYYLEQPDFDFNNLSYLLCHELLHILNKHSLRKGNRIHETWCIACDHVIEMILKTMSHIFKPYKNNYNIIPELENDYDKKNWSVEQVYNWIIKQQQNNNFNIENENNNSNEDDNLNYKIIKVFDKNNNLIIETPNLIPGITSTNQIETDPVIKHQIEQFTSEAHAILENIKSKGDTSGNLITYLTEILKIEIPWDKLIERSIKTNIILEPDDRGWRKPNLYFIPHHMFLPGTVMKENLEGTGKMIICVDTSGSISDINLKKFSSVIYQSLQYFKNTEVFIHDTIIHQTKIFNKENINEFHKFISTEGFQGRGGTSHKYVFNKIEELWEKEKDELSIVISLTDMYSDIEKIYKNYKWIKNNLPLIFIATDNKTIHFEQGFGNITQIQIKN